MDEGGGTSLTAKPKARARALWIEQLHNITLDYVEAEVVGGEKPTFSPGALDSPHIPRKSLTELLVCEYAIHTGQSRTSLQLLLEVVHVEDSSGNRFDPRDAPESAEHLISRSREKLPLLRLVRRKIEGKDGRAAQAVECYFNLIFQRMLQCPRIVQEFLRISGRKVDV